MNEIAKIDHARTHSPVTVNAKKLDRFAKEVSSLVEIAQEVQHRRWLLQDREKHPHAYAGAMQRPLSALPPNLEGAVAALDEAMQPATREHILDSLSVITGLYAFRGDPDVLASAGVAIIEAEELSVIAVQATTIALLRPIPGKRGNRAMGEEDDPPQARKFMPTVSEYILEARAQHERWQGRQSWLAGLAADHALAMDLIRSMKPVSALLPKVEINDEIKDEIDDEIDDNEIPF